MKLMILKNAQVYAPKNLGLKDILIAGGKIIAIKDEINIKEAKIIDFKENILCPGFIDTHVHITGGGGEGGFKSIVPPLQLSSFILAGITTVVGLLGTDGLTRSVKSLIAKAKALKEEGLSVYALTGSYAYPSLTLTGDVRDDIVFIDEIIGVKIAISDHRDSSITENELAKLGSAARVAGMIANKAGIVILHLGDAKSGLKPMLNVIEEYNIPQKVFRPTHVNRNPYLLDQAKDYAKAGGYIDLTCGIHEELSPSMVIKDLLAANISLDRVTMSSDGGGSYSSYDEDGVLIKMGVAGVSSLHSEFKAMIDLGIDIEIALRPLTSNTAKALSLYPTKGCIKEGSDADILMLDKHTLDIKQVLCKGKIMQDSNTLIKGTYE